MIMLNNQLIGKLNKYEIIITLLATNKTSTGDRHQQLTQFKQ